MKISTKLFLWFLIVTLVPVFIVGLVVVIFAQNQFSERITSDLSTIADIQVERLDEVLKSYKDTHNIISSNDELSQSVARYFQASESEKEASVADLNESLQAHHKTVGISRAMSILNTEGIIIASTSPEEIGKSRANIPNMAGNEPSIVASKHPDENGDLLLRTIGPITYQDTVVGVLEMITNSDSVARVATNFTGLGETGETILALRTEDGDALFLAPTRFDPDAGMKRTVSHLSFDVPMTVALLRQERVFISGVQDYRNVPVIAATRYYEPLDWGIVIKIDQAEAFRAVREIEYFFWYAIIASVLIALFFSFEVSRELGKPLTELTVAVSKMERGEYDARCKGTRRKDELGILAKAFNEMAERVQYAHKELEQKVKARTSALKKNLERVEHLQAVGNAMLSSIGEAVVATDVKNNVTFTNLAFESLFALKHSEVLSKDIKNVLSFYTKDGEKDSYFFKKVFAKQKQLWSGVLFYKKSDDQLIPIYVSLAPVVLDKKIIGHVFVMRDISEEKEIEKAKTEFVSIASHQLRTPLSAINWYVELLADKKTGKLNRVQMEYSQTILASSKRMVELVNALLNVSRIETGKILIDPEPQKIEKIVEETFTELKPQISKKKLFADLEVQKRLPLVPVDKRLMHIVVQNLLTNAIKYTPDHGAIHASVKKVKAGGTVDGRKVPVDSVLIAVSDNGYGIPEHQQEHIFQKLFRADNAMSKAIEGTGLGLYVTKSIINHADGMIWFESEEDKGTTFYVTIPLKGMPERAGVKTLIT